MRYATKKPIPFHALRLGDGSPEELGLIRDGKLQSLPNGSYRVFSLEVTSGKGELAYSGDYLKFSSDGWPYPNGKAYFEANHEPLPDGRYRPIAIPLPVWCAEDGLIPEIEFLCRNKGLTFHPESPDRYFSAPLWDTELTAPRNAIIVIYSLSRDPEGQITDASFNFVDRREFELTYDVYSETETHEP